MSTANNEMVLVQRDGSPKTYNGTLRVNPKHQAVDGEPAWKKFVHPPKKQGASAYLYIDMLIATATSWSSQTSKIGTPIFEKSFLWDAFMHDFSMAPEARIIDQATGNTGKPFVGWWESVEIGVPIMQLWKREGHEDQWNLVETTRVFIHEGDDAKRVRSKAVKYIINQADDPANKDYKRQVREVINDNPSETPDE